MYKKLTGEGYEVETAENGEEGLSKIKEGNPDLILLDIIMPKMGGFEMLEKMQEEGISGTPVIVVSNSGQPVEIDKAQKLGATDWIVKTEFDPQEVINKVAEQIGEGESGEEAEGGESSSEEEGDSGKEEEQNSEQEEEEQQEASKDSEEEE